MKIRNSKHEIRNNWGFTLIELIVVIAIIGIVTGIASVALRDTQASARDVQRKADLEDIRSALEIYRADCGNYPTSLSWNSPLIGPTDNTSCAGRQYMSKVPQDIQNAQGYTYVYSQSSGKYDLYSYLEKGGSNIALTNCGTVSGVPVQCKYKVSSP